MPRIVLSALAAAFLMSGAAIVPASGNDTLSSGSTSGQAGTFTITFQGQTTAVVDPANPTVVYVGGQRYSTPSTTTVWEKTQELKSGQ